jgi:hypothetical protein
MTNIGSFALDLCRDSKEESRNRKNPGVTDGSFSALRRTPSESNSCSHPELPLFDSRSVTHRNGPKPTPTPRFNMPCELGMTITWQQLNPARHTWFVFESRNRRLQKSLSDLDGTEPPLPGHAPPMCKLLQRYAQRDFLRDQSKKTTEFRVRGDWFRPFLAPSARSGEMLIAGSFAILHARLTLNPRPN